MQDKARANLEAARVLAERGWFDAAANRAYFALFQAGVAWMQRTGRSPEEFDRGAKHWRHATITRNASLYRRCFADLALFHDMRALRIQADYDFATLRRGDLDLPLAEVARFLDEVCS